MADALLFEFENLAPSEYHKVNEILGLDPNAGTGPWPDGLISHTGLATPAGGLIVTEVWESQAKQEAWMASTLGPALGKAGVPDPKRVEWMTVLGYITP